MNEFNWEQAANKFYEWCIKNGIDLVDNETALKAFKKITR
jgi:hypothetical protein